MKKVLFVFMAVVLFIFTTAFTSSQVSQFEGKWSGEFKSNAGIVPFQTHFWTENGEVKGTIDFPYEGVFGLELSWIIIESPSLHFEVVKNSGILVFDGKLIDNRLVGKFLTKTDRGTFELSHASNIVQ
jgi:hypothetical protein